jgi:16S rRNA U1498 N3-methylase RsmE
MKKPKYIPEDNLIPDDDYNHLKFVLRTQINALLQVFNCYGLKEYIDPTTEELVTLAENFGQAVRGDKHKPIHVIKEPKRRATE